MISRGHGRNHPLLEGVKFGIAIALQNALEGRVAQTVEVAAISAPIPHGMGRIEMGTWNPAVRYGFRRRMSPLVTEQLRQHVGVRPLRTFAVRSGNRLKGLDASDPAHKHPMRACSENDGHCRVARFE